MLAQRGQRLRLLLLAIVTLAAVLLLTRGLNLGAVSRSSGVALGQWVYLSDLSWNQASTGWLGVANEQSPARDRAFHGAGLSLNGVRYKKGLGVYPLSEITYDLAGEYSDFASEAGLDDAAWSSLALVRFLVYVDGALSFDSGYRSPGDETLSVSIPLGGARRLRLVVDAAAGQGRDGYADWAEARLFKPLLKVGEEEPSPAVLAARAANQTRAEIRQREATALQDRGRLLAALLPAALRRPHDATERPTGAFAGSRAWLSNGQAAIGVGVGGVNNAAVTMLDIARQQVHIHDASPVVALAESYNLTLDSLPDGPTPYSFRPVDDPVFGVGTRLELRLATRDGKWRFILHLSMFGGGVVVYQITAPEATASSDPGVRFHFVAFEQARETLLVGADSQYLTDFSRLRYARIYDDLLLRQEVVGKGKPVFIWSATAERGLLMALLDEPHGPTSFSVVLPPGRMLGRWGIVSGAEKRPAGATVRSPRLFLQLTPTTDIRSAFVDFHRVIDQLYPEPALPSWFKYQWLTWYRYNMDISDEIIRRQADYIAANLGDLGPWNILIDAGWYVSEGRPGAGWRAVDTDKFPDGLRALVNRLHDQRLFVVLYLSAPYIDSRERPGDWLGLRSIIDEHPDWLFLLGSDPDRESYVFDFYNPDVQAYWSDVMEDFFVRYAVDGMKIDGIGNAEGAILDAAKVDPVGLVDDLNEQTMFIYEFFHREATRRRADAYIETGWVSPTYARPFAHTFRYGDEAPRFRSPYPFPGLVEHIDYAIIQRQVLAQRANMGAIYGDPNTSVVNRWWLQAALALGTHVTLGFDLPSMTDETLSLYRSLLTHYAPFRGVTTYGPGLRPLTFATTRRGTTYLGVLNRTDGPLTVAVPLADHGIDIQGGATAYDVENDAYLRLPGSFSVDLAPESFRLFIVRQDPGVLWTNCSYGTRAVDATPRVLTVTLTTPATIAGHLSVAVPKPNAVFIDGLPLLRTANDLRPGPMYAYNADVGVLFLVFEKGAASHVVTIRY